MTGRFATPLTALPLRELRDHTRFLDTRNESQQYDS